VEIDGYVYIDPDGLMTAYTLRSRKTGPGQCLALATGKSANAALAGRILRPGRSPGGEPDYETTVGDVTFGVFEKRSASGNIAWFVHSAKMNNTANVTGTMDSVTAGDLSFAITGRPLSSPTLAELQDRMCAD
jgi:hypothetical protein